MMMMMKKSACFRFRIHHQKFRTHSLDNEKVLGFKILVVEVVSHHCHKWYVDSNHYQYYYDYDYHCSRRNIHDTPRVDSFKNAIAVGDVHVHT